MSTRTSSPLHADAGSTVQLSDIAGAAIGAGAGYLRSKKGAKISRATGKTINKGIEKTLDERPIIATGLSVAASVQATTRINGGGERLMTTIYAEKVAAARAVIAPNAAALTQERTDIISHASVGAKLLQSSSSSHATRGAAIVAFGLEDKPTAEQTETIGHAAAVGSSWGSNYISDLADQWLPESVSGYAKDYFTPTIAPLAGAAYASHVAIGMFGKHQIEFD